MTVIGTGIDAPLVAGGCESNGTVGNIDPFYLAGPGIETIDRIVGG
jgi:hypothetical protein